MFVLGSVRAPICRSAEAPAKTGPKPAKTGPKIGEIQLTIAFKVVNTHWLRREGNFAILRSRCLRHLRSVDRSISLAITRKGSSNRSQSDTGQ